MPKSALLRDAEVSTPDYEGDFYSLTEGDKIPYDDVMFFTAGTTNVRPWFGFGDGCSGVNADFRDYLKKHKIRDAVQDDFIAHRNEALGNTRSGQKAAEGHVAAVDLTSYVKDPKELTIKHLGYTAGPDLRVTGASLDDMKTFGRKFRLGLEMMNRDREARGLPRIEKFAIPPFSSGIYKGGFSEEAVAKAFWVGFCAEDRSKTVSPIKQVFCANNLWRNILSEVTTQELNQEMDRKVDIEKVEKSSSSVFGKSKTAAVTITPKATDSKPKEAAAKEMPAQVDIRYAYTDHEIDAVITASDKKKGYGYATFAHGGGISESRLLTKTQGKKIEDLTKEDLLLNEKGKPHLVLRIPAIVNDETSSIKTFFTKVEGDPDVKDHIRAAAEKFPGVPIDILIPYKVEGWHWNACKISITHTGEDIIIRSSSFDPNGRSSLPEAMQKEIREALTDLFPGKIPIFQAEDTNEILVQEGVSCGVYTARMLAGMADGKKIGKDFHHGVFDADGNKKSQAVLRGEDLVDVMAYASNFERKFLRVSEAGFVTALAEAGSISGPRKEELNKMIGILLSLGADKLQQAINVISLADQQKENKGKFKVIRETLPEDLRGVLIKLNGDMKLGVDELQYFVNIAKLALPVTIDARRDPEVTATLPEVIPDAAPTAKEQPVAKDEDDVRPVKEKYEAIISRLKELQGQETKESHDNLAGESSAAENASQKEERGLRAKIAKDFFVLNPKAETVVRVGNTVSVVIDVKDTKSTVQFKIGQFCDVSKDESGRDNIVVDRAHAKEKILARYKEYVKGGKSAHDAAAGKMDDVLKEAINIVLNVDKTSRMIAASPATDCRGAHAEKLAEHRTTAVTVAVRS